MEAEMVERAVLEELLALDCNEREAIDYKPIASKLLDRSFTQEQIITAIKSLHQMKVIQLQPGNRVKFWQH